ncbi:hypothetical protein ABXN37_20670 [Piscinibacter sakaiensis]|uniref:hypothetical protein n=1 Tax=Piscinibacter sakaiensis TaxID=1547922 RepID=UPI003728FE2F
MHAPLPAIHLVVMQPTGYVHSLGLLDPARYLRHMLRRLGASVSLAKNRLREDALNLVFGAHLGFPAELLARHACVFVNLEQLGPGGAAVTPDYLALLRSAPVADYDADNLAAYGGTPDTVPVLPFLHAPYLQRPDALPLDERPFDLLFFGSMNPRRQRLIERIEACGRSVAVFDAPLYGPERDDYIVQARAVLNCHFYDSSRFEQVRVAHCLSLGTPVVSERRERTRPGPAFEDAVDWFDEASLEAFFTGVYPRPDWASRAADRLGGFAAADPLPAGRPGSTSARARTTGRAG